MKVLVDKTAREQTIIEQLWNGKRIRDIAKSEQVSYSRGKQLVSGLYAKFGVAGKVELLQLAVREGWIK